jgi:hypothetical protein
MVPSAAAARLRGNEPCDARSTEAVRPPTLAGAVRTRGEARIIGNALANILSAARAEEKAVDEAAKRGIKLTVSDSPTSAEGER